ncbi:uncharacterized protein LOC116955065 [Petromyzon marinus]|uniref:uncharacterized protein LOC116955065 n=1 Tax=Petromyzon marinus TaxID=7757 RepID=UPI003F7275FE
MWRTALLIACGASAAPLSAPGVVRAVGWATWAEPALVLSVCGLAFLCVLLVACSWCLPRPIPFKEFEDPLADEFGADDFIPPGEDTPSHHAAPSPPPGLLLEATTVADVYTLPRHHDQQHRDGGHTAATVNRQNISYLQELGRGWFGQVLLGEVYSQPGIGPVAVRQLEPSARLSEQTRFLHEVQPYRAARHEHVQRCVSTCTEAVPLLALMEFCPMGDVKAYLSARAGAGGAGGAGEAERCRMARQVAAGLAHLHQQGFVHRDLALRNCLLSTDLTVKIGDYGIGPDKHPDDYVDLGVGDPVALRWLAPELLLNLNAQPRAAPQTAPGNVWAMGVTLWELLESGARPYGSVSDEDVLSALARDSLPRLPRPALRSPNTEQWYEVLLFCWLDKERRPSASEVHQLLAHLQGDKQQQQQQQEEEEEEHRELLQQAALLEAQPQQPQQPSSFEERWNALAPPPPQLPGLEQQPDLAGLTAYFPPSPAAATAGAGGIAGLGSAFPLLQPIGGRALPQGAACERPGALEAGWWEPPPVGPVVVAGAARGNPFLERPELEPGAERRAPPDPVPAVAGGTRAVTLGGSHLGESSTDPGLNGAGALWDNAAGGGGGGGGGTSGAARDPLLGLLTTDRLQDNYFYLKNTALIKESARSGGAHARAAQAGGAAEASLWGGGENAPAGSAATTGSACPPDSTTVADLYPRTGSMQPRSVASPPDPSHLADSLIPDSARPPSTSPHSASRLGSTTAADISPLPDSTQASSTSPPDSTTTADSLLLDSTHSLNSTSPPDSTTTADSLLLDSTHPPSSTSPPHSTTINDSLLLDSTHSPNSTSHPDSTSTADSLLLDSTHSLNSTSPPHSTTINDSLLLDSTHSLNSTSPPHSTTINDSLLLDSTHSPNSTSHPDSTSTADSLLLDSTHSLNLTSPPHSTTINDSLLLDSTHSPNSTSHPDSTSTADSLLLGSTHSLNSTSPPHSTTTADSPDSTVVPRSTHPLESSHLPKSSLPTESTSLRDWNLLSHSASPSHSTPPTAPTRPPDSSTLLDPTLPSESVTPADITCPPISTHLPKSTAVPTTLTESTPQTNSTSPPESTLRPASSFPTASITLAESTARNNSTVPPESTPPPASSFPSASSTPAESTTPPINSTPPPPSSTPLIDPTPPSNGVRVGSEVLLPSRPPPPPPATAAPHHVTREELNTNNNNQWSGGGGLPAPSPNSDWSRLPDLAPPSPLASPSIGDPSDEPDAVGKGEGELAMVPAGAAFQQHLVVGRALLQADEAGVCKSLYRDSAYFSDLELDKHGGGGGGADTPLPANGSDGDADNEMKRNGAGPERRHGGGDDDDDDDDVSSASSLEEVLTGGTESHDDDDDDDDDFDVGGLGGGAGDRDEFLSSNPFEGGFVAPAGMSERDAGQALGETADAATGNDGTGGETPRAERSEADATGGAEDATQHADDGGDAPGNGVADDGAAAAAAAAATEAPTNPFDIPFIDAEDSVSDEEAVGGGYGLRPGLDDEDDDDEEEEEDEEDDDDEEEEEDESWDSDEDWGPVPEVVMEEEEVARSLKGLLKRPRGPARTHGKRVSFFDDVTVHLFNKAFPTSSLGGSDTCDHGESGDANSVGGGGGRLHVTTGGVHTGSRTARPLGADRCSSDDSSEDGSGFEWDDELMPGGIRPPPVLRIPRPSRPPPPPPRHRPPDPPAAVALPLRRAPPVPLMPPAVSILSSSPPRLKLSDPAALIQSRLSGSPGLSFTHVSESDVESPPGSSEEGDGS